jgi:hypothetical protein
VSSQTFKNQQVAAAVLGCLTILWILFYNKPPYHPALVDEYV